MSDPTQLPQNTPATGQPFEKRIPVGEELLRVLIAELEYIFTRDYLSSDPVLVSHFDSEFFLPIKVIENHPHVKAHTSDSKIVYKALCSSEKIIVDEPRQLAKPSFKLVVRNTIIIRDIPKATPEEEVRALFGKHHEFLSKIVEMKPECGDNYFVQFDDEDVTLEAWKFLRTQAFQGKSVQARIKSENILRRSYVLDPEVAQRYQDQSNAAISNPYTQMLVNQGYRGYEGEGNNRDGGRGRGRFNRRGGGRKDGTSQPGGGRGRAPKGNPGQGRTIRANQTASLTQWWPPLPTEGLDVCGYDKEFLKYSRDDIISVISAIQGKNEPVWTTKNTEAIRAETVPVSEILKPVPKDVKVEWADSKHRRASNASRERAPLPPTAQKPQTKPAPTEDNKKWSSLLQNGQKPA